MILPLRVARSSRPRAQGVRMSHRPAPAGSVSAISCVRGMKELGDFEYLPVGDLRFVAHAREAARANLEVRHPDRVFIGHRERKLARGFLQQAAGAVAVALLDLLDALEPRQEVACVVVVLIVLQPFDPGGDDGARVSPARLRAALSPSSAGIASEPRRLEPGAERGEAAVHADPAAPDRRLECHARERQRARAGERAEQHRADHAAGRVRQRRHVEGDQPARGVTAGRQQGRGVGPAVGERDLLGHREDAMGRGDQQCLVRRDEAALDGARPLPSVRTRARCRRRPAPASAPAPGRARPPAPRSWGTARR